MPQEREASPAKVPGASRRLLWAEEKELWASLASKGGAQPSWGPSEELGGAPWGHVGGGVPTSSHLSWVVGCSRNDDSASILAALPGQSSLRARRHPQANLS